MRTHTALAAWLPTARQVEIVELLTVTKPSGAVWRYVTSTGNVSDGTHTWLGSAFAGGLLWHRDAITFKAGIDLSDCKITLHPRPGDTIGALSVASALRSHVWDDATFLISRAYFDTAGTLRGVLPRYQGQLAPITLRDGDVVLSLKPPSQTFNRAVPPVYQAACQNYLFDAACGVSRAAHTVTGTVQAGSTAALVETGRSEDVSFFTGGVIAFTSGALVGLVRTVRSYASGGAVVFFEALPAAPAVGDTYTLTPGCDRSLGAGGCAKFDNRARFRGQPFIPKPETAM